MPRHDPLPAPRASTVARFRRTMRLLALVALATAATAVILVMRGQRDLHVHMLIAAALGVGLTVMLAGALMTLLFMSSSTGHDEAAAHPLDDEEKNG